MNPVDVIIGSIVLWAAVVCTRACVLAQREVALEAALAAELADLEPYLLGLRNDFREYLRAFGDVFGRLAAETAKASAAFEEFARVMTQLWHAQLGIPANPTPEDWILALPRAYRWYRHHYDNQLTPRRTAARLAARLCVREAARCV